MPEQALAYLDAHENESLDRLRTFLTIPSVSTDPAYKPHIESAADWVADQLRDVGFDAAVEPTAGHPVVVAHAKAEHVASSDAPRVLFYGHYDVQPPDPVELWQSPPFEPTVRDGAIYARGACDDKGQVMCFLESLRAWRAAGQKLPCNITVLIEGEEECGSISLGDYIEANKDRLAADIALVSDTSMWDAQTPAITYALRGLVYYDIQLHGPNRDLHSGIFGGTLANPATVLSAVLGQLFDDKHRVTVPGFYDDVLPLTDRERQQWATLGFDEKAYLDDVGASTPFGEAGYTTLERRWGRPSCDVNGLYGGYGGEGAKTIIPSFAGAKVSFRIAPDQDPVKISDAFESWLRSQDTHGCRWEITNIGKASPVALPPDSPWIAAASRAIEKCAGKPPVLVREGASIPVVADFKTRLGLDTLLVGFALNSDLLHSPNEHFALARYHLGRRTHAMLLSELAKVKTD